MNKIRYTTKNHKKCTTNCPFGLTHNTVGKTKVGSYGCSLCEFFVSNDMENQIVECNHPDKSTIKNDLQHK